MRSCPDAQTLSAYLDSQADPLEERRVAQHLVECPRCAAWLRSAQAIKAAVKAVPVPAMPEDLKFGLRNLLPPEEEAWSLWREMRLAFCCPAAGFSVAVTLAVALFLWSRSAFFAAREVPAELLLAAHNQYALTLPLAPAEKIMTEMPAQMALAEGAQERDVY